jgi:hypothetical protein
MGISQSMIDSIVTACDCINHLHVNCTSAICTFDVDTKENITVDSLPTMSNVDSLEEAGNMDSYQTLPPPINDESTFNNEHNHNKILTNIK